MDAKVSPAPEIGSSDAIGAYETYSGRAFGELDPDDPRNTIITDIRLAPRNAAEKVEYVATFFLVKPIDSSKSSRLMWQFVPNRGGSVPLGERERGFGDIGLTVGWQGDNSGTTAQRSPNHFVTVPVAKNADGSSITGPALGRIINASGAASQPLIVFINSIPYQPATLDTRRATLVTHTAETMSGEISGKSEIPSDEWAWAACDAALPFPGRPDPTQICLKNGFDAKLSYTLSFTAKDPYVLGIGFAAFRDVGSFFRNETADDFGTPNPLAEQVSWVIGWGRSQAGNFLKAYLHLGFNQDEAGRRVQDGIWPMIAAGQIALNVRFATPDGAPRLYSFDREAPQWWAHYPDAARKHDANGILDRCTVSQTCPKIVELFGAAELWFLKMSAALVGTAADVDIALPQNVRRYYIASSPHGGGPGGFDVSPLAAPQGPGTNWGQCVLPANPMPYTETSHALIAAFRNWVMNDTPMPPSRYPTLREGTLVAPTRSATGFPKIPGLPSRAPDGLINLALEYDFGPTFSTADQSGVISIQPPTIKKALPARVPKLDADGNELGGVPVVLRDAPLGTYLGWNITGGGFFEGQLCSHSAGMIPFARTESERLANGDARLSLEERYGDHDGYVSAVRAAAERAMSEGFLLERDAAALIAAAVASDVLNP